MSVDIEIAGNTLPTDASALKGLRHELHLLFHLDSAWTGLLDSRLDHVPATQGTTKVSYGSPAASWNPSGGPVTIGLQGGAGGALKIVNSGELVSYADGLAWPQVKKVTAAAGTAYVCLTLNVTISANVAGTYSSGPYGVTAALDTKDTFSITYCKAMPPATKVRDALKGVFESFVLPLHRETLTQMLEGDYLLHEFTGKQHLAFGAYVGLDKALYAGQASVDVVKALGSSLATVCVKSSPEVEAGASFNFKITYAARFDSLLSRSGSVGSMHLFRSTRRNTTGTLRAGLRFDPDTTTTVADGSKAVQDSIAKAVGGAGGTAAGEALGAVVKAGDGEVQKYLNEATDKLTSWTKTANSELPNLEVEIQSIDSRLLLAGYTFDLGSAAFDAAWGAATGGDLVAAFKTGAVTLETGSGLEQEYQRRTTFRCNFFHLWNFSTWSQYANKVALVYAGNNVFHLVAQIGRTVETESMGAMHRMDLYFAATASTTDGQTLASPEVDLKVRLTAQKDAKAIAGMADLLGAMGLGPRGDALARDMRAFGTRSKQGIAQVEVTIPPAAYARIQCDPYVNGRPPATGTTNEDAANWRAFAQAADDLDAWPLLKMPTVSLQMLRFLKSYAGWQDLNKSASGSDVANRLHQGVWAAWPSDFPDVEEGDRTLIKESLLAGQSFMTFCEAVHTLASVQTVDAAGTTWNGMLALITDAVRKDLSVDFLRPAALALVRLCGSAGTVVSGPSQAGMPAEHFSVSIAM